MSSGSGAVAAVEYEGARAGAEILRSGGNAVDAAIAGAFAQTVVDPWRASIGGAAHILYYSSADQRTHVLDAGGVAPLAATADMYRPVSRWENAFLVENDENLMGFRAQTVPGFVRGMDTLYQRAGSGRLSWRELLAPSIALARDGFAVHPHLYAAWQPGPGGAGLHRDAQKVLNITAESRRMYLKPDGSVYGIGEVLVQEDLARTLEQIADEGANVFYTGTIAARIADDFAANGGLLSRADLESCRVEERDPIRGSYRDLMLLTENAPSVGPVILEMLNILELADLRAMDWNSGDYLEHLIQVMFAAFRDRDEVVGDVDDLQEQIDRLLSKEHAGAVAHSIETGEVRRAMTESQSGLGGDEGRHDTTHMTVLDGDGNACGITHSVGSGTGVVTPGLGFMHNCHMMNYDPRPGHPNSIAPGKRGTGGGAPVFGFRGDQLVLSMGSPAGNFKASGMVQTLINVVDFDMSLVQAVSADRIHVRAEPPLVIIDRRFEPRAALELASRGYALELSDYSGRVAAVARNLSRPGFEAASDIRGDRGAIVVAPELPTPPTPSKEPA